MKEWIANRIYKKKKETKQEEIKGKVDETLLFKRAF